MSLSIFDRGESRYDLYRGEEAIGWIDGRTIGFDGFESRPAARRAATVAYDALSAWLARDRRAVPAPRTGRALRARRAGTVDHLTLGEIPVGRVLASVQNDEFDGVDVGSYSFELVLPPRLGSTLSAAQVAYNALERHRALRALEQAVVAG